MSFSGKSNFPQPEPKIAGIDPKRVSSSETARCVPYVAGINRVGVIFLGEAFDVRADAVYQDAKKADVLSGYNYYASFAALISLGALDSLKAVYIEEELVWEGNLTRDSDYEDFTIEDRGNVRIYWGTETQGIDATLATAENQTHPAYRGQAYLVFTDYFIGYNRTALGNIEVVVARHPAPAFLNAAGRENVIEDANVPAILHDWWTGVRAGLHLPESRLDTDSLGDVADTLFSECLGVSPVVTRQTGARQLFIELLEYVDGYLKTTPAGLLTLGLVRETPCADITIAFDETDLAELPTMEPEDWDQTSNSIAVTFSNRENHYQADPAQAESAANRQITGGVRQKSFERRWFTRQLAAQTFANILASRLGQPGGGGRLVIRKSRLQGLEPGDVFRFSYAPDALCHLLCRCIEVNRPDPARPVVEVLYEVDRGNLAAQFFTPPEIDPPPPTVYVPAPITRALPVELPYTMDQGFRAERMAFLVARANGVTTQVAIHRQLPSGSYSEIKRGAGFALRGVLDVDYPADTLVVDDTLGVSVTLTETDKDLSALTSLTLGDALEGRWLMLIIAYEAFNTADAGTSPFEPLATVYGEWLSVYDAELLGAGQYRLKAVRARFDTKRLAHAAGTECWIISRDALAAMTVQLNELATGQVFNLKFQPFAFGAGQDLADAYVTAAFRSTRCFAGAPSRNLRINGSLRPTLSSGQDVVLTWNHGHDNRPDDLRDYATVSESGASAHLLASFRRSSDDTEFHQANMSPALETTTIPAATFLSLIGGTLEDFYVLLWGKTTGLAGGTTLYSVQHGRVEVKIL